MRLAIIDWHGEADLRGIVCLGHRAADDTLVVYWGARPDGVTHVLALPSRALDPIALTEWCGDHLPLLDAIASTADEAVASDLRAHLATHASRIRRLVPAAIALARVPDDAKRTAAEQAAEVMRVEGLDVSPAAIERERAAKRVAVEEAPTVRLR